MNRLRMFFGLVIAAGFAWPSFAVAQNKPAVIISVAGVEENLADVAYLTRAAGVPDVGKSAVLFGGAFTQGIDKKRPIAVVITPDAGDFQAVACIPVSDMEKVKTTLKQQRLEATDAGDGVLEFGEGKFYLKEAAGWAFVSNIQSSLKNIPADPAALVADLQKQYNVAVQVKVRNIPEEHRKWAVDQINSGFDRAQTRIKTDDAADREAQERMARNALQGITDLIEEADTVTIGLAINPTEKKTYLDFSVTALEGSKLAKELESQKVSASGFTGFVQPNSAMMFHLAAKLAQHDIEQLKSALKDVRAKAIKEVDDNPKFDANQRATAKEVVGTFFDVVGKTVETGVLDGGAVVQGEDTLNFALGGFSADGPALENALRKLVEIGKADPDFPSAKLNVGEHAGVKFHRLTANIPGDAKAFFGDKLDITIGFGAKSFYVGGGKQGEALVKRVIDQSASGAKVELLPMQLTFAIGPILKLVNLKEKDPLLTEMISALEKAAGNDKVRISAKLIPRGTMSRFEIDEGVLQLIGIGIKRGGVGIGGDL